MGDIFYGIAFLILILLVIIYYYHQNSYKYENIKKNINKKIKLLRELKLTGVKDLSLQDQEAYLISLLKEKMSNIRF